MSDANNIYVNSEKRIIVFSDYVDETSVGKLNYNLINIIENDNESDKKEKDYKRNPIKLYINSCGGYVYDMWSSVDIMLNSKTPIYTYCTGHASSSAFLMFLAGSKRYAGKYSKLLYHSCYGGFIGKVEQVKENAESLSYTQDCIEKYVTERCKITQEQLDHYRTHKKDWYINCKDAIDLNVATDIYKGE